MKNQLIQLILDDMNSTLNHTQLRKLRKVLSIHLTAFSRLEPVDSNDKIYQLENNEILQRFVASKKLEGCSAKTLRYYSATIQKMLTELNQPVCDIQTDDLRNYLSDYQAVHKNSRVTIDNIRRIFSSFFAWLEDEEYILKSPVRRIHRIKTSRVVKDVFSDEDIELLRENCDHPRDLAMLDLLLLPRKGKEGKRTDVTKFEIVWWKAQCLRWIESSNTTNSLKLTDRTEGVFEPKKKADQQHRHSTASDRGHRSLSFT